MENNIIPTYALSFETVDRMRRPLVYVRRRLSDGKAIYIGMSTNGLERSLDKSNHKARLSEGEVLEIYLVDCQGAEEPHKVHAIAQALEDRLIHRERPELNGVRKDGRACSLNGCPNCNPEITFGHTLPPHRMEGWGEKTP